MGPRAVAFTPEGPDLTRVEPLHRHLDRYGPEAERMRRILEDKGGEPLDAYAHHVAQTHPSPEEG